MPKLPRVTPRKFIAALLRQGFYIDRQKGSHVMIRHRDKRQAVIPRHAQDLPPGTLKGILDDLEISIEELIELL